MDENKIANIMILGSGGREHAIAWWFHKYGHKVFIVPGNPGTGSIGTNIPADINKFNEIANAAIQHDINIVVVGPETPLVDGIGNFWKEQGLAKIGKYIFAPSREAAMLEGSKIQARKFAKRHGIPIPEFKAFESNNHHTNANEAKNYLRQRATKPLLVVKADGLCAGKGVIVNNTIEDTLRAIDSMAQFEEAGRKFLLEERLIGEEATITAITDSNSYKMFHHSQDHKRRYERDKGPNTGGMGAYAPSRLITSELEKRIKKEIIQPTISGINQEKTDYKGILYFAIMIQGNKPYLLEYNCRFGDPETQVILPLVDTDPYELMMNCINGKLEQSRFKLKDNYAGCVVLVTKKYPEGKSINNEISIDPKLDAIDSVVLFHAGTKYENNKLLTNGGRIIGVTGLSEIDHKIAIANAYEAAKFINFEEKDYRKDIGKT